MKDEINMADKKQIEKKEVKQRWIADDILQAVRNDESIPTQIKSDEGRLDYRLRQIYNL